MKKLLLLLSLSVATLFASPAFVYYVESLIDPTTGQYGYESITSYGLKNLYEASPYGPTYISLSTVHYAQTAYKTHSGDHLRVYVYFPVSYTNDAVFISKRNQYEVVNGLNGTEIKGYAISPYKFYEQNYLDGSKLIGYEFTDLSGYYKRITVATCPNNQLPTAVQCNFAVVDINGTSVYSK